MVANEDYRSLVQGVNSLDFSGDNIPCKLLLDGDSAFPVIVTPAKDVLIAASRYGKGRVVVTAHESYLDRQQLTTFLQNVVSWLEPSPGSVIGVQSNLDLLAQTLSAVDCTVERTSGLKPGLGVLCISGYDDHEAQSIISFVREGGGLLIGAQAWNWSYSHKEENVLLKFPGNKITSVSGVYFTSVYGEKGIFNVSPEMPRGPFYMPTDFSSDLKHLLQGVSHLNISGEALPSELLLHGALTFPIGLSGTNQCFLAGAYYGKGRVVVGTHESQLSSPQLQQFILNAISWLDKGRKGQIGVNKSVQNLYKLLQQENVPSKVTNLVADISVYCCDSYSNHEAEAIQKFVAEGGGLFIAGHAWYWSYQNSSREVLSDYPGNKILNKLGISILTSTVKQDNYKALNPDEASKCYIFRKALSQLLIDLKSGADFKPPLSYWLPRFRQDVSRFMRLPGGPLISAIQQKLIHRMQNCEMPNISKQCPVESGSKEALMVCLAYEVSCLSVDSQELDENYSSVTVQIDGTNPGHDAWRSTGLYLPPRRTATLLFPATVMGKGLEVQVGCHTDDLSSADKLCRAPVVTRRLCVDCEKMSVSCFWGGLLYIIVKEKKELGMIPVTVYGAEPAPTFIHGQTTLSSWKDMISHSLSPWSELITENIILTVPTDSVRSLEDPEPLLSLWDKCMNAITDLAASSKKFPRPERFVTDVQISAGWMHAGYPIMCHLESAGELTNIQNIQRSGFWGPIHELGHNQQQNVWEFPSHTTEATCNLWSVYVHETVLGIPRDRAHPDLKPDERSKRMKTYLQNGAKLKDWSVWTALETYLQLQEAFSWDPFKKLFAEYQTMPGIKNENNYKMNLWSQKFSQAVQKNLAPFFKAWGWPLEDETCKQLSALPEWENNPMK
ncbi:TRPM8 channel-associated factor homolog [Bombina bombina]|uniref:TRPM8 channel-associated factor homolog n=1 Tax=Bombina bombina TaxID=8345 RepID=UPI00235AC0AB|nr:TRPM8 channel-associated factor homolog [Bombina bombina]